MNTLAITSSTDYVAIAVSIGDRIAGRVEQRTERRHAEELTPMLAGALDEAGIGLAEVHRVVVDVGPGRYTGMRVGIATAKAIGWALDLPMIAITSLDAILLGAPDADSARGGGPVVAVVDARRGQVFAQVGPGGVPLVLSPEELTERVPHGATFVGDGADVYSDVLGEVGSVVAGFVPHVDRMALLPVDTPTLRASLVLPRYLREPDAQINIKTRPHGRKERA